MNKAVFDGFKNSRKVPCKSAEMITYEYKEVDYNLNGSDWFHFYVGFPGRFEEVVMVKAVDIQTAIGNAGGYIGLFLGKIAFDPYR